MKCLAGLMLFGVTTSAFAAGPSIAGKWDVATSIAGNDGLSVCTFDQKESVLTGSCRGDDGVDHTLTGKLAETKITWEYKSDYNGQPLTIGFSGTVNSEKQFAGSVDVQPMGVSGDFTAKRKP